nr:unnamed protein product [Callosobruchus analis]
MIVSTLISCMEQGKSLPPQEIARWRHHHASQVNADIKKVVDCGLVNKVQFNEQNVEATALTKRSHSSLLPPSCWGSTSTITCLGMPVVTISKTASQKLWVLFRCSTRAATVALQGADLLESIQNIAVRLIDAPNLTKDLHSLFYRFYHGRGSSEFSQIVTPKAVRTRNTREALRAHLYQVEKLGVLFRCRKLYTPEQLAAALQGVDPNIIGVLLPCVGMCSETLFKASGLYPEASKSILRADLLEQIPHIAAAAVESNVLRDVVSEYLIPLVVRSLGLADNAVDRAAQAALFQLLEAGYVSKFDAEIKICPSILALGNSPDTNTRAIPVSTINILVNT